MARRAAPPDAELVELPGVIHESTSEIPGSTESKPSSHDITISKTFQKKN